MYKEQNTFYKTDLEVEEIEDEEDKTPSTPNKGLSYEERQVLISIEEEHQRENRPQMAKFVVQFYNLMKQLSKVTMNIHPWAKMMIIVTVICWNSSLILHLPDCVVANS